MTDVSIEESCGNSPRKGFLRDFYVALAGGDVDGLRSFCNDDVQRTIVGDEPVDGVGPVTDRLIAGPLAQPSELTVRNIITHGNAAAANGTVTDGNGTSHSFCDVFAFDGYSGDARIESIESYVVEMD